MIEIRIRNVSDATHRALKERAAKHGHSMNAEMRKILIDALHASREIGLGTYLA